MGRIACFLTGVIVGGILVFASLNYHLVRANDGFHTIPKLTAELSDSYVDIRTFGLAEWQDHRQLAMAIVRADKAYLLGEGVSESIRNAVEDAFSGLGQPARRR